MSEYPLVGLLPMIGATCVLVGFMFRNQIPLRIFAATGNLFFVTFYFFETNQPIWTAILMGSAIVAVNLYIVWRILSDTRSFKLRGEEMMLFARLPGMTPGQFKELLNIAAWHTPKSPMPLTMQGTMPESLHYVLEGKARVEINGTSFHVGPHAFIGELAFLRGKPATATTYAEPQSLIVSWRQPDLKALMQKNDGVRRAIDSLLTADLAEKIARPALPTLQEQSATQLRV